VNLLNDQSVGSCVRSTLLGIVMGCAAMCASGAQTPQGASARVNVIDDQQRAIGLGPPAHRIVSLAPHLTDIVVELGAGARLVATDPHSDAVTLSPSIVQVAAYPAINPERILALAPDLILVWGEGLSAATLARLEALGLRVFVSRPQTLDDVARSMERIGALIGVPPEAGLSAARFRERLQSLSERHARTPPLPVFVQIWETPLITLGLRSVMSDALNRCGARNVFAATDAGSQRVSPEAVLAAAPKLVISTVNGVSDSRWRQLGLVGEAPRRARFLSVVDRALERPSPPVLEAVAKLCAAIDAAAPR
jgi:iron complex transport system substrate-binding protein